MNTSEEIYIRVSRADLNCNHLRHRNGESLLCSNAIAADFKPVEHRDSKPLCSQCLEVLEDREYRAARQRASAA